MLLATGMAVSQIRVSGRVYDMSQSNPLALVSVLTTNGEGTVTDSTGHYTVLVRDNDSIWFSYLGKATPKYAVVSIPNTRNFEVSLHVNITELKPVMVKPRNYRLDSMQNRQDYAKAFNFEKPGLGVVTTPDGATGMDLDEFINIFRFGHNRRMAAFRDRLFQEEIDKYIEHRFSRALVIKLTQMHGPDLDTFMVRYKPDLFFTQMATDYEFQSYIKKSFEKYMRLKRIMGELQKDD